MSEVKQDLETGLEVAVIGMAGRFPGANNIEAFWNNLTEGIESISFLTEKELEGISPELRDNPNFVKTKGGFLENIEYFDASFFNYTPMEAEQMAPQIRIFHECLWEVLEDAGYDPECCTGLIGLYTGVSSTHSWELLSEALSAREKPFTFASHYLNNRDYLSTLVSYKLNLKGPAYSMHTTCSTSLVAIHLACQGLLSGDCDMALAGGIAVRFEDNRGYVYEEGMILSPDGHCRAFDADAQGSIGGKGVGIVALKRFEDAVEDRDNIYGVIKGSAINNDGNKKVGYTAPSIEGQAEVIRKAHKMAGVHPEDISYVEAHGTGTPLGDVTEVEALKIAFNTDKKHFCGLGSVKTNVGHLDVAAGVAGFIKTILALKHQLIPPSLHFKIPNPKIDFENSPFYVNASLREWKNDNNRPLRAGVSAFGIGGTNAHVVLEAWSREHGAGGRGKVASPLRDYQLILLSAKTQSALDTMTENLANYLTNNSGNPANPGNPGLILADAAYTLQVGRRRFPYRRKLVCSTIPEAIDRLTASDSRMVQTYRAASEEESRPVVFMFPGLGPQYVNMGLGLYRKEPLFREEMDRCFEIIKSLMGYDIKEILYPPVISNRSNRSYMSNINETEIAQLVIFIFEYALAKLLIHWGITPRGMIGYSFGEYAAACLSGVFSLEDALRLLAARGKLLRRLPPGMMLSVPLSVKNVEPLLNNKLSIGIDNGSSCVVSGPEAAVRAFEKEMKGKKLLCTPLESTHGIHSQMMDPILMHFEEEVGKIALKPPQVPYISTVTGHWIKIEDAQSPAYWAKQLRATVRFAGGMQPLLKEVNTIFLEVGPGRDISALVNRELAEIDDTSHHAQHQVVDLVRHHNIKKEITDDYFLLDKIGRLWLYGVNIDWSAFYSEEKRYRISLPTYPFERQRYWQLVDDYKAGKISIQAGILDADTDGVKSRDLSEWFYVPSWKRKKICESSIKEKDTNTDAPAHLNWVIFINNCGLGGRLIDQLKEAQHQNQTIVTVKPGARYAKQNNSQFTINPKQYDDYETMLKELHSRGFSPHRIVHLWGVTNNDREGGPALIEESLDPGFYSLLNLARALGRGDYPEKIEITVVTNNVQDVTGDEPLHPGKAAVLGPCCVIPQEYPNILCRSVDVSLPEVGNGTSEYPKLLDQLIKEITYQPKERVAAFRKGRRWVQVFDPVRLEGGNKPVLLREGGVYWIIGGLGNIGYTLAECLIKTLGARVILTGRSNVLQKESVEKLKQLEAHGGEVVYFSADAADKSRMLEVIRQIEVHFGRIDGVIHSAYDSVFNTIADITITECHRQFRPKIYGVSVLEEVLQDKKLDFCLMISSISTILGGLGFAAYAAANHFMDAFSIKYNRKNREPWIIVNWEGMNEEDTAKAFHLIFSSDSIEQVVFSNGGDLEGRISRWVQSDNKDKDIEKADSVSLYSRPALTNPYVAPRNSNEQMLADIWQHFFGIEKIGVTDDLFDLGGDSLKAVNLLSIIHKEWGVAIPIQEFFDNPTIEGAVKYLTGAEKEQYISIEPVEKKEYYALSSAQERMYIFQQMNPDSIAYNSSMSEVLEGDIDSARLEETFKKLIERHESLRTSIVIIGNGPVQKIDDHVEFKIEYVDLTRTQVEVEGGTSHSLHSPNRFIKSFVRPFDLSRAPLLRVGLEKMAENKHLLMVDTHHITFDGISTDIFNREFAAIYQSETLPLLKLQYKDYSQWQNSEKQKMSIARQEKYWKVQFEGEVPVLELPTDFPRPVVKNFEGSKLGLEIGMEETRRLKSLAAGEGATLYMVLAAVVNIFLSKISGCDDIIVGTPVAGRYHADLDKIIGIFINTLAMRNNTSGSQTFKTFLQEVKHRTLSAFENQDYPYEDLVEQIAVNRDTSRNALFDVMFVMQNMTVSPLEIPGLRLSPYKYGTDSSKFDVTVLAVEAEDRLLFTFEYSTELFKRSTIQRFTGYFKRVLTGVTDHLDDKISQLEIITESEKQQVLFDFNDTTVPYPTDKDKTIHEIFEQQAEKRGDRIAVIGMAHGPWRMEEKTGTNGRFIDTSSEMGPISLSYNELNQQSNRVAFVLKEKGVEPGTIVGIMVKRSIEMIVGILGILKAGGVYLPIEPDYPDERVQYMLADSAVDVMVTTMNLFKEGEKKENIYLDSYKRSDPIGATSEARHAPCAMRHASLASTSPAYIIYTSGSTGMPKGVMVAHGSVVNILSALQKEYPLSERDTYLLKTSYIFDVSVAELFGWYVEGGRLAVLETGGEKDPRVIMDTIERVGVTHINFVPSMFNVFVEELHLNPGDIGKLSSLKYIFLAGEALLPGLVHRFRHFNTNIKLENIYGPTEGTIYSSSFSLSGWDGTGNISIGKPMQNIKLYILDKDDHLQPVGIPGELCICGAGMARGYLNQPELTAERFNMSYKSYRSYISYKTGDLARWLPDGHIEFLGRIDHQIKIRGFRVELGEIENRLLKHESVKEAVVLARRDETGDSYLCAYIAARNPEPGAWNEEAAELKEYLARFLPDYMIPSYVVLLQEMPLTPSGKVDRGALPPPGMEHPAQEYIGPRDEREEILAGIWSDVLGIEKKKIGIDDNFFDLGGHSLKATILTAKIQKAFGINVSQAQLFKGPTVRRLSRLFRSMKTIAKDRYAPIEAVEEKEYYPLSSAQSRFYVLQQVTPESTAYNMTEIHLLHGNIKREKFEDALKKLIRRHKTLRTSFRSTDGLPVQCIHKEVDFKINDYIPAETGEQGGMNPLFVQDAIDDMIKPFDLSQPPLLRLGLIKTSPNRHILIFDMHHIISDGTSMMIFLREFMTLYSGRELQPLRLQFKDFAHWQYDQLESGQRKEQEAYWSKRFSGELPVLNMPIDFPRPPVQSFAGHRFDFSLEKSLTARLGGLVKETGTTLFIVLEAVYTILLSRYTGQEDIVIGTTVSGRYHPDQQNIIGLFIETLALRNQIADASGDRFYEFLKKVRQRTIEAYDNQDYPFKELIKIKGGENEVSRNPLFDVMLMVQNLESTDFQLEGLEFSPYEFPAGEREAHDMSKVDFTIEAVESEEEIHFSLEYCTRLYKQETMERFAHHFINIINAVVSNPTVPLAAIEVMDEAEKKQLLETFNNTSHKTDDQKPKMVHERFEDQAARTGHGVAVVSTGYGAWDMEGTRRLKKLHAVTYKELNEKSSQLARVLIEKGVGPNIIVAIMVEPSVEMVIAILGILKSGGAYLPIDPDLPEERIKYMLADSGANILSTVRGLSEKIGFKKEMIYLDSYKRSGPGGASLKKRHAPWPMPHASEANVTLAYVIYTSGSTGWPKGVLVEHRNLSAYIEAFENEFHLYPGDTVIQQASYIFDAFVEELYPILVKGGKLVIPGKEVIRDIHVLSDFIVKHRVTMITSSPQLLNELDKVLDIIPADSSNPLESLRILISGGDRLRAGYIGNLLDIGDVYNTYGPTEATVCATYYRCLASADLPSDVNIGTPIMGYGVYILDRFRNLSPVGVPGELCITGAGVTRGYLNRPELTTEKFDQGFLDDQDEKGKKKMRGKYSSTSLPLYPSTSLYRTGDLARYLSDGTIEFLGRMDRQVKIRGYRIELGEIENRLLALDNIKEAVVVEGEKKSGQNYPAAYIVCKGHRTDTDTADVKNRLQQQLPDYMVPTFIMEVEEIPLTPTGKVDRERLLLADVRPDQPFTAPGSQKEKIVAETWKEVLETDRVGLDDNFFDLGGTSLDIFEVNKRLNQVFKKKIPVVSMFQHSTVRSLVRSLEEGEGKPGIPDDEEDQKELSGAAARGEEEGEKMNREKTGTDIAVIGMAGVFPGARNIDEFWENLKNGVESIRFFTDEELKQAGVDSETLKIPNYVKARGVIDRSEYFDSSFFGYTPMEAQIMDPQMRIFTQCVWHALEDAGYDPFSHPWRIGLYAGASPNLYWEGLTSFSSVNQGMSGFMTAQLADKDFMCTHISYKLNLKGPSFSVQTACSTSLVAIHLAVQGLQHGECEMALAGGVSITYPPIRGYLYQEGMIFSPDGHNKTFDAEAKGSVFGDGCGVVVLKSLEEALVDRDNIYAVIKGSATNNDGLRKVGYTAPSIDGQVEVIRRARQMAGVNPESITYLEAHGTATPLGDTVEIEALEQAFDIDKKGLCGIGTVKSNVGHLYSAAGVAGFIKTVLALKHRLIPPSLHFKTPNPQIDFENSFFYVNTELKAWENNGQPLRAGVSSFGIGGTNAHVVLEEATQQKNRDPEKREQRLILLSAKTGYALNRLTENLIHYLKKNPQIDLADAAYTLQVGRNHFPYRRMVVTPISGFDNDEDADKLSLMVKNTPIVVSGEEKRKIIFMICGQGSQYVNMGRELYEKEPVFRREMDRCFDILKTIMGCEIKEIIYPVNSVSGDSLKENEGTRTPGHKESTKEKEKGGKQNEANSGKINQTEFTQPLLFAFEYALARLLMKWGIKPHAMIGYSFGEYIAACLAGVFSLEDALELVIIRGKLIQRTPVGAMVSVPLPEKELKPLLKKNLSIAIVNGPTCIVSGEKEAVDGFSKEMKKRRIMCVPLNMSHAIHSGSMGTIREEFEKSIRGFRLNKPKIPYISNITALWTTGEEAVNPHFWGEHLCSTVRFSDGLKELLKEEDTIFVEIGPGRILGMMVRVHPDKKSSHIILNTVKHPQERISDDYFLLDKVGQLWLHGQDIDWAGFYGKEKRYRISLPGYPFEGKRYWIDVNACAFKPGDVVDGVPLIYRTAEAGPGSGSPPGHAVHPGEPGKGDENYTAPRDELEQMIARMWQELMGLERVGIHDDFFHLNGSSLVATQIMARLMDEYQVGIPINRFYEEPTIAHLAKVINELQEEK